MNRTTAGIHCRGVLAGNLLFGDHNCSCAVLLEGSRRWCSFNCVSMRSAEDKLVCVNFSVVTTRQLWKVTLTDEEARVQSTAPRTVARYLQYDNLGDLSLLKTAEAVVGR